MTFSANIGCSRFAGGLPPALTRVVAVVLLGWMLLSNVSAPLTACCGGAQPCCAAALSGQGCPGCSTMVTIPASPLALRQGAGPAIYFNRPSVLEGFEVPPPWTPPD